MSYTSEERETVITTDETMTIWNIFTRQQKVMTKLKNIGVIPVKTRAEDGVTVEAEYNVLYKQISFRKIMEFTEEQRQAKSEHMKAILSRKS